MPRAAKRSAKAAGGGKAKEAKVKKPATHLQRKGYRGGSAASDSCCQFTAQLHPVFNDTAVTQAVASAFMFVISNRSCTIKPCSLILIPSQIAVALIILQRISRCTCTLRRSHM